MKKTVVMIIAALAMAGAGASQPLGVLVWNNARHARFIDPDVTDPTPADSIGCETKLVQSLLALGYAVVSDTLLLDPMGYDAIFVTNGWKDPDHQQAAGVINLEQRNFLRAYMDAGKPVFMDGNDVAFTYLGDPGGANFDPMFMLQYFGVNLEADYTAAPVDSLHGIPGTPFEGVDYKYSPFTQPNGGPRSSVDLISPYGSFGTSTPIFHSTPEGKWIYCRGASYSSSYKEVSHTTVMLSFILGACQNTINQGKQYMSTRDDLLRRILRQFSGNNRSFYPAPLWGLSAATEGHNIRLTWAPHPDSAVIGYRISRSIDDTMQFQPCTEAPVPFTTLLDASVQPDRTYWYKIAAFTAARDTSRGTEPVWAMVTGVAGQPSQGKVGEIFLGLSVRGRVIHFTLAADADVKITAYNMLGQTVREHTRHFRTGSNDLSLPDWPSGQYLVRLGTNDSQRIVRVVLVK